MAGDRIRLVFGSVEGHAANLKANAAERAAMASEIQRAREALAESGLCDATGQAQAYEFGLGMLQREVAAAEAEDRLGDAHIQASANAQACVNRAIERLG